MSNNSARSACGPPAPQRRAHRGNGQSFTAQQRARPRRRQEAGGGGGKRGARAGTRRRIRRSGLRVWPAKRAGLPVRGAGMPSARPRWGATRRPPTHPQPQPHLGRRAGDAPTALSPARTAHEARYRNAPTAPHLHGLVQPLAHCQLDVRRQQAPPHVGHAQPAAQRVALRQAGELGHALKLELSEGTAAHAQGRTELT